jgi:hypothetical protein
MKILKPDNTRAIRPSLLGNMGRQPKSREVSPDDDTDIAIKVL